MEKQGEEVKVQQVVAPQDIGTSDITSSVFVDASKYRKFRGVVGCAALTSGQTVGIQLMQAKDAAGTEAKALGTGVTTTAPADGLAQPTAEQEADQADLDEANGFLYVGVKALSSVNSKVGYGVLCLTGVRAPVE